MCFIADIVFGRDNIIRVGCVRVEGNGKGQCVYAGNGNGSLEVKGKYAIHCCDGTDCMIIIRKGRIIQPVYRSKKRRGAELKAVKRIKNEDVIIIIRYEKLTYAKEKYLCELVTLNKRNRKANRYYKNIRELFEESAKWFGDIIVVECVGRI